jgi:hypothetical protein
MEDTKIKEALAYSMASDLHEGWRASRQLDDGTYDPRIKKSNDESWNAIHGTDEVDIANSSFKELPSNWQYENLEAAKVVINLVYDRIVNGETFTPEEIEDMAAIIHEEWVKRNDWVKDPNNGNPILAGSYEQLPEEEKEKDKKQINIAYLKIRAYMAGIINIESICNEYGIDTTTKQL